MRKFKSVIALALALVLVFSCIGSALAVNTVSKTKIKEVSKGTSESTSEKVDKQTQGFKSETFKLENTYQYADDEVVRAIIIMESAASADVAENGTQKAIAQGKKIAAEHTALRKAMSSIDFELKYDFTTLLNGMSVDVAYGDLDAIAEMDGVKAVYIANTYDPPVAAPSTEASGEMTGNTILNAAGLDGEGTVIAVLDTGLLVTHEAFQAYGNLGDVALKGGDAIIAAGAPGVYVNAKVPFAYDYADSDTNVANSDADGHGTHVAGIAAGYTEATDGAVTFSGAAPAAQILAMKIFSDDDEGTTSDVYFAALEDAYLLGADVINMSIGAQNGFTYDSELEDSVYGNIYEKLTDAGIVVCVAAGNEGSQADYASNWAGSGYVTADYADYGVVGSPSTYGDNLSIASVENLYYPAYTLKVNDESFPFTDSSGENLWMDTFAGKTYDYVVVPGVGDTGDFTGISVSGKIAVISRGEITFEEKVENAAAAGAIGVVVVNNQPGTISMAIDTYEVPAVSTLQTAMAAFTSATVKKVTVSSEKEVIDNADAYLMSDFSSWGTTPDLTMKPTMTSVGGNVYSAVPSGNDAYGTMSGTSMATPNMAGTFANVLQALKEDGITDKAERAELATALLEASSDILIDADGYIYSVRKQGTGLANSDNALKLYREGAYITNPIAELGDDASKTGVYTYDVEITNDTDEDVTYDVDSIVMRDYVIEYEGTNYNTLTSDYLNATVNVTGATTGSAVCYYDGFVDCVDAWYHSYVDYVVHSGLMNGIAANKFAPSSTLTRGMVVTVLYREAGEPTVDGYSTFTDVATNRYYSEAVAWAQKNGIVNGVTATTFEPDSPVTREQLATIMYRYDSSDPVTADLSGFIDTDKISNYAKDAMNWAVANGIINGITTSAGVTLDPKGQATRAQFATIITRYLGGAYDCNAQQVTIPAGETKTFPVTVTLSAADKKALNEEFENGAYVEGYVSFYNDDVETHATFLAFYGDWTQGSVLEEYDFRDAAKAEANGDSYFDVLEMNTDVNFAYLYDSWFGWVYGYAGDNLLAYIDYNEKHIAITNETTDGTYYYADCLAMLPTQLRNAESLTMTIKDKTTGKVYYEETLDYVPKAAYDTGYGYWDEFGVFFWDGTDSKGAYLPNGTVVTVTYDAVLPYNHTEQKDLWSFDVTIDTKAPVISKIELVGNTLTVTATDENYLQAIYLCDEDYAILDGYAYSSDVTGETKTVSFDVTGLGVDGVFVTALDYATNEMEEWFDLDGSALGDPATVSYTANGVSMLVDNTNVGKTYTFAEYSGESIDGYEFECWVTSEYAESDGSDIGEFYYPGEQVKITGDMTVYALYAKGEYVTGDPYYYYFYDELSDYSGEYALVGLPYDEFWYLEPQLLDGAGNTVDGLAVGDVTLDDEYDMFYSDNDNYRWNFELQTDGTYTIQNVGNGKYLALSGSSIAMVSSVTSSAKWYVEFNEDYYSYYIYSAANTNMILLFDDENSLKLEIFDDSQALSNGAYPSDWYAMWLYAYTEEGFNFEYFTTSPNGSVTPDGLVETALADIKATDEVVIVMYAPYSDEEFVLLNNGGTATYGPASVFDGTTDSTMYWNIKAVTGGYTIYPNGSAASWLFTTNANNGMRVGTDTTGNVWKLDSTGDYLTTTDSDGELRYLGVFDYDYTNNAPANTINFRAYKASSAGGMANIAEEYITFYVVTG